ILVAFLITISNVGGAGAWLAGTARVPFVAGLQNFLPRAFGALHPRFGTPHVALLVQGIVATLLLVMSFVGHSVEKAYLILIDMTIIVYFIPYLYMFAAFPLLGRPAGLSAPRQCFLWVSTVLGFCAVLVAILLSLLSENLWKVGGGAFIFVFSGAL